MNKLQAIVELVDQKPTLRDVADQNISSLYSITPNIIQGLYSGHAHLVEQDDQTKELLKTSSFIQQVKLSMYLWFCTHAISYII